MSAEMATRGVVGLGAGGGGSGGAGLQQTDMDDHGDMKSDALAVATAAIEAHIEEKEQSKHM
jgi:hypothetical protein